MTVDRWSRLCARIPTDLSGRAGCPPPFRVGVVEGGRPPRGRSGRSVARGGEGGGGPRGSRLTAGSGWSPAVTRSRSVRRCPGRPARPAGDRRVRDSLPLRQQLAGSRPPPPTRSELLEARTVSAWIGASSRPAGRCRCSGSTDCSKKSREMPDGSPGIRLKALLPVLRQTVEAVDRATFCRLEGDFALFPAVRTGHLGHLSRAAATIVPGTATRPAKSSVVHLRYSPDCSAGFSSSTPDNNLSP
jgi:hypothetical protein